jgi:RimJ/RimL family protein N-acetyltransferase
MKYFTNEWGQPIGPAVEGWTGRPVPEGRPLIGLSCRLERLNASLHGEDLARAFKIGTPSPAWTYLPYGPFATNQAFLDWLEGMGDKQDPLFYVLISTLSKVALGVASYQRIDKINGVIEVGHIHFSDLLKRTTTATEAMFLMMQHIFEDLGYRRYEWKCDSLNQPSRTAAERLGFRFEGIFRQAIVYKGRSRDTAWYSIVDWEWPKIKEAYLQWLAPENLDPNGINRIPLTTLVSTRRAELEKAEPRFLGGKDSDSGN